MSDGVNEYRDYLLRLLANRGEASRRNNTPNQREAKFYEERILNTVLEKFDEIIDRGGFR